MRTATTPSQAALIASFALAGVAGGWLLAESFAVSAQEHLAFCLVATVACTLLGWATTRVPEAFVSAVFGLGVLILSATCGGILGDRVGSAPPGVRIILGFIAGVGCSVPFTPALAFVLLAGEQIASTRGGTIASAAAVRQPYRIVLAQVALGASLISLSHTVPFRVVDIALAVLSTALVGACALLDARAVKRLAAAAASVDPSCLLPIDAWIDGVAVLDFGIGADVLAERAPGTASYREADRTTRLVHGSSADAGSAVARFASASLTSLSVAAVVTTLATALAI